MFQMLPTHPSSNMRSSPATSVPFLGTPVRLNNKIICSAPKRYERTVYRRLVVLAARNRPRWGSTGGSSRRAVGPAATDAAGLFRALIQLASSTTIVVGSHQSYALLEALESQLQDQLPSIPVDTAASGLWAMTRLQLQPSTETLNAVATYLLQPQQLISKLLQNAVAPTNNQERTYTPTVQDDMSHSNSSSSTSGSDGAASAKSRLAGCSSRVFAGLCYSLNFYMLRDLEFWAAAASVGLQHLPTLKPTGISNLLQGIAASGWTVDPNTQDSTAEAQLEVDPAGTTATYNSSSRTSIKARNQQTAVSSLLRAVEQLLLSQPQQLQQWRMRDISQMCQAYALTGYNCTLLFAVVANHLLGISSSSSSGTRFPAGLQDSSSSRYPAQQWSQQPPLQQQQQWNIQSHGYNATKQQRHFKGAGPPRLAACRPADAAGLAWAYVAAFCTNQLLLKELAAAVAVKAGQLHAADCCRLLWAYATAGVVDQPMLAAVTAATAEEMHGVAPRTAAGSVWSLAQMRYEAPAFMEAALDRLAECLEATQFDPSSSDSSSSTSNSRRCSSSVHTPATGTTASSSSSSDSSSRSGSRHDIVAVSVPGSSSQPSVLQQLLHSPCHALLSGGPAARSTPDGEFSMLSMMHRTRRSQQQQLLQQQEEGGQLQDQQQQQHLRQQQQRENDEAAAAAAGGEEDLLQQLQISIEDEQDPEAYQLQQQQQWQSRSLASDVVHCTHRDVAQAVYACGRLQHYNGAFFRVLRVKLLQLLPGFSDSQLVMVLWGLARLNLYDVAHTQAAAAELLRRRDRLHASLTALAVWCFAALKHRDTDLFKALAQRAVALAGQGRLRPLDATQLVRAMARMSYRDEALLRAAAHVLQQHMPRLPDSMIVSSLWGFAVSGVFYDDLFAAGFAKISTLPPTKARPLLLLQLFQTALLLQDAFAVAAVQPPARLPPRLLAAASRQWMATNRRSPGQRPSSFQISVGQVLRDGLGLVVQQEALTDDGLFSIDLAVEWKGRRVAVEVDGPKHFTNSTPYCLLGSSLAKQRCLQARGWAVLSIPFYKWNELANMPHNQHQQSVPEQQQQQQQPDLSTIAAATGVKQRNRKVSTLGGSQSCASIGSPATGNQVTAAAGLAAARAQYLLAALDEAVATADVPRDLLRHVVGRQVVGERGAQPEASQLESTTSSQHDSCY